MPADWSLTQRLLHWTTAILVIGGFVVAFVMVALPLRELVLKFTLYQVHKSIGLLVLVTVLARLALRLMRGRPAHEGLSRSQARAASVGHGALYGLLIVVPVLGYCVASTASLRIPTRFLGLIALPDPFGANPALFAVLRPLHLGLAIALVALAAGHAAMAVYHHLRGNRVLWRMWSGEHKFGG
jgi:cytochrome b561